MKTMFLIFSLSTFIISCDAGKKITQKNGNNLKDYALCSCIIEAFKRDSVDLKDVSISVLYELSDYNINLSQRKQIDSLTTLIVNDIKPMQPADYGKQKARIFNCLQYYKEERLEQLIKTMRK